LHDGKRLPTSFAEHDNNNPFLWYCNIHFVQTLPFVTINWSLLGWRIKWNFVGESECRIGSDFLSGRFYF
jgi:hypothetical protein